MKRKMLFIALLLAAISLVIEAAPVRNNGYYPPGTEQTIDKIFKSQISLPIPVVPVYELQSAFAPEVAFTGTGEMIYSECTSQSNVKLYNSNYQAGYFVHKMMPRYSMAS